jgi:hypothetical protein
MRVLGLDPSLRNFGWVLLEGKQVVERGTWHTTPKMEFIDRYRFLRESLQEKLQETKPEAVGIEFPIFNDLFSEGMYGLFLFACEALKVEKMDAVFLTPPQVKAHAREFLENIEARPRKPKWKMEKFDMIEAAKTHSGGKGRWNDHEADAYWVGQTATRFFELFHEKISEDDLSPVEKHQFMRVHTFQRGKKAGKTVKTGILHREQDRFFRWSQE